MKNKLLQEYTQEVIREFFKVKDDGDDDGFFVKLAKKFIKSVEDSKPSETEASSDKQSSSELSIFSKISGKERNRLEDLIDDWIEEIEEIEGEEIDKKLKKQIERYGKSIYSKFLKKYDGKERIAYSKTKRALDVQYAKYKKSN